MEAQTQLLGREVMISTFAQSLSLSLSQFRGKPYCMISVAMIVLIRL